MAKMGPQNLVQVNKSWAAGHWVTPLLGSLVPCAKD